MKDYVTQPDRIVNVKDALDATVTPIAGGGLQIGAAMKIVDLAEHAQVAQLYPAIVAAAGRSRHAADSQSGHRRRQHQPAAALLVLPQRGVRLLQEGRQHAASRRQARTSSTRSSADGPSHIVHPSSLAVPFVAYGATFRLVGPNGERRCRRRSTSRCRRCRTCGRRTCSRPTSC